MNKQERDFVALFNASWYRNFPIVPGHEDLGKRALWTVHIGSVVKQCADFVGLFTCFETGGRTDAILQKASRKIWARIEWEWTQPYKPEVNELKKLASAKDSELLVFVGYSRHEQLVRDRVKSLLLTGRTSSRVKIRHGATDDRDRSIFLDKLKTSIGIYQVRVHAYVLMSNHFLCGDPHNTGIFCCGREATVSYRRLCAGSR